MAVWSRLARRATTLAPRGEAARAGRILRRRGPRSRADAPLPELPKDPVESAKAAGLRYVDAESPGITRRRSGTGFTYLDANGRTVRDPDVLRRIRSLAIPPAWTNVWICPAPNGHVQAVGRDAKGRKQYRYHPRWRQTRDETKYTRMLAFARALPGIRARVERDLALPDLPRQKVIATVVRLLETTLIRVGNEEYARENKSFGLTTMRDQHVKVSGSSIHFQFRGKAGKQHEIDLADRRLATIVKRCQDLPGQELFQYVDENGEQQTVDSADVNEYLREVAGEEFTAKDFRTWAGTVLAALALDELQRVRLRSVEDTHAAARSRRRGGHSDGARRESKTAARKNVVRAIEQVAKLLGNTPAICRKCYVHPAIFDAYQDGLVLDTLRRRTEEQFDQSLEGLRPEEAAVLVLLQERLAREAAEQRKIA